MNDDFMKELLAAFQQEAAEHLAIIGGGLQELANGSLPADAAEPLLESLFREMHSLKGAARSVDLAEVGTVCQTVESLFAAWKKQELRCCPEGFPCVYAALDGIQAIIEAAKSGESSGIDTEALVAPVREWLAGGTPPVSSRPPGAAPAVAAVAAPPMPAAPEPTPAPTAPNPPPLPPPSAPQATVAKENAAPHASTETIRVDVTKLDRLMRHAEELLVIKQGGAQQCQDLLDLLEQMRHEGQELDAMLAELRHLQRLMGESSLSGAEVARKKGHWQNLMGGVERLQEGCKAIQEQAALLERDAEERARTTARLVDELLDGTKELLMISVAAAFQSFPRMVRELCRTSGKDADFTMTGQELEMDKRVLEEMKDPLIHLLRNAVDHGLETANERQRRGKPAKGTISMSLRQREDRTVLLEVTDDGGGIDAEGVKSAAVRAGILVSEDAARLDERAALMLIFRSAVTTSRIITDLSGRGLGMAIVQEKVEKLGGRIDVETTLGGGTRFGIILPLSLATFRGLLVRAGGMTVAIPSASVEQVLRTPQEGLRPVENRESLLLNGQVVPFVQLATALQLPPVPSDTSASHFLTAVVMGSGERRVAFGVDSLDGEQEILVKSLGPQLARVRNVAGAAILTSGSPVPVLHPQDLIQSAIRIGARAMTGAGSAAAAPEAAKGPRAVLVAEDSITSRMLLKNLLENSGYTVQVAVDGMEAWGFFKTKKFAAIVSDVDMPRMDGFALATRIRATSAGETIPIILVTARETREDRERGIEAGANAYIVKSSFDQSNLLEILGSLV